MKTWITGGYVYHYEKRRLERKNLCMEDGVITEICSPSKEITEAKSMMPREKQWCRDLLIFIHMAAVDLM